ncbi:MAG: efflux RND transporter permease subunit [Treponema sp.]|nr:efflux RND transporter permease subunit [Treponema sp.]MCL2236799.1 efflux RND transporter permease subunit [Treponema sp.]
MKTFTAFLERKKMSLCILAGICAVAFFVIYNGNEKIRETEGGSYAVKIKHYGIDAAEMERTVTVPLEDMLFSIPGVMSVQSSSENSLSSVFVRFRPNMKGRYEAVRDAAQRVYETLPSSAQRPEIFSSNNSRIPVWSASVVSEDMNNAAQILEKIVKPRFESLEGAGEVIVSGVGLKEIFIILDQEKLGVLGLEPSFAASVLGTNDSIFSGGSIVQGTGEIIITVDGRYSSLEDALIPTGEGRFVALSDIAQIVEREREPDIYSRLNGKKTAGIAVMGRNGADLRKLSSDINRELSRNLPQLSLPLEFTVLSDIGAEESAAYKSVINAAMSGAIMVAFISFLLRMNAASALAIPLICLFSIAVLTAGGFSLDRLLLAGIAAGIGTAIDAVILCSEKLRKCTSYASASASLSALTGPLIAGGATTIAALIPLSSIEDNGAKIIASAIAVVTVISLLLSLTLFPPLLLWKLNQKKTNAAIKTPQKIKFALRALSRKSCRFLASVVKFCAYRPYFILAASFIVTLSAVFMLLAKGTDAASYGSEDSVYAQVEFDGSLLAQEVDRLLAAFSEELLKIDAVKNVETGARTSSGSVLISFDPKLTKTHIVREKAKQIYIPGGFIFFHENSVKDRYWEIFIYGDEEQKCRELAEELAYICAGHPLIRERILNFKKGGRKLVLIPDREVMAKSNVSFSAAASRVRLGVFGPVAYKRINEDTEIDVRVKTGASVMRQSREGTLDLLVSDSLRISTLMNAKNGTEPSSIRRDNRRRFASITISTKPMDPRRVKKELSSKIASLELPPGYSIEFDPQAIRESEKLSATVLSLVLAVIFCYMIIAGINESFAVPLLVLSAIPPSLAIPAITLVLLGSSYNSAIACAFIAVSGMTVNAAILCVDAIRRRAQTGKSKTVLKVYSALREKLPALLSTTGTTVAGAVPFLFLTEGANALIKTLSLTGALGVACSCICSITVIPSLLFLTKNHYRSNK